MKKQTKKTVKPVNKTKRVLIVDLSTINDISDIYYKFAIGKCNAGIELTQREFISVYAKGMNDAYEVALNFVNFTNNISSAFDACAKHFENINTPWYKKVWKKITKPFRKNK